MKKTNIVVYGALTLVSLFYGINFSVLKIAVPMHVGAYGMIVYRVCTASLVFWIFLILNYEKINWRSDGFRLLACGLTGVAINQLLFYKGLSITSAVNGSIIMTLTPVLVLAWAFLLINERITLRKILGISSGLIGAVIIIYQFGEQSNAGDWRGDILVLANGASYGLYLVLVKPLMEKYRPMTVITWVFSLSLIFVLPVGLEQALAPDFASFSTEVWLSIGYQIIFVTVLVYFFNAWTLSKVNASVVGAFIYLQPIFAAGTALLFFDEVLLIKHFIAVIFVFGGVYLVTKK